jgi:hypothetical protein
MGDREARLTSASTRTPCKRRFAYLQGGGHIYDQAIEEGRDQCIRRWAYCVPHAGLYLVATVVGIAAWLLLNAIAARIDVSQLSGGTATLLVATAMLGVLGVSGALGRLLYIGNKFL